MANNKLNPQEIIETGADACDFEYKPDSRLNFDRFEPNTRYLVTYEKIDDTMNIPGIAQFTINRNDGSKDTIYGLGRDTE